MKNLFYLLFSILLFTVACKDDDILMDDERPDENNMDLADIPHDPQPYTIEAPDFLGEMIIPEDNPMTVEGVALGRFLFYDPILSADSTQSCSSCHHPAGNFTDNLAVSVGIDGIAGTRNSMPLLNVGYVTTGFFWDGRAKTLEEQALLPVEDPIELHETWPNVMSKLREHPDYPKRFREAFDIIDRDEMTKELAAKAIAQFERTLVSSGESKYDRALFGTGVFLSDEELNGSDIFFFEFANPNESHPGCSHDACHGSPLFTLNRFTNNGLDAVDDPANFLDLGKGGVTGNLTENGRFRVPSLRNIALTAPYMHDGRFETLDEVIDHYASGGHPSLTVDSNIGSFTLTEEDRENLKAFLHAQTDTAFTNNPAHQNPFQ